jgi:hypothetical protein
VTARFTLENSLGSVSFCVHCALGGWTPRAEPTHKRAGKPFPACGPLCGASSYPAVESGSTEQLRQRKTGLHIQDRRDFLRATVGTLGLLSLAGCGGGGGGSSSSNTNTPLASPLQVPPLLNVTADIVASVRAHPENFLAAYAGLSTGTTPNAYVTSKLGSAFSGLTDAGSMATYATTLAYCTAPVGSTSLAPIPATMRELLSTPAMACGHFCKLTSMLTLLGHPEVIPPDGAAGTPTVHFLVWIESVPLNTGFHSQLIVTNVLENAYLLLDPTYAYALRIPFTGAGPQSSLTVIENAATMLHTPIAADNLVLLDKGGTAAVPQMVKTLLSGALSAGYIEHDSIYGSEGWDTQIAQIFDSMG